MGIIDRPFGYSNRLVGTQASLSAFSAIVFHLFLQLLLRLSQGFGGTGEKAFISGEQGNKGQILRGTGEQRQYWGTGNKRKQIFDFWGTGEQVPSPSIPAPGRASLF